MALFGLGKKEPAKPAAAPAAGIPTDLVIQMKQQGMSNDQITQNLQSQGYTPSQIFDAISQADIKGAVEAAPPGAPAAPEAGPPTGAPIPGAPAPMPEAAPPGAPPGPPQPPAAPEAERERIEEVAEAIIDEKWDELMKNVDKIAAWKETTEIKITNLEQAINNLKERFEELHKGILAKVGEYDKGIRDVGSEIKAMEGVFKKVLPTLTENVSELSRITKTMKGKKKPIK